MDVELTGLQMNLVYLKKLTIFTNININIRNHKNGKFVQNKPECLWPLLLQLKCNK